MSKTEITTSATTSLVIQQESGFQEFGVEAPKRSNGPAYDPEMWYSFADGTNKFRVVTPYRKYKAHSIKKNPLDLKDFGKEVKCSAEVKWEETKSGKKMPVYQTGTCPACDLEAAESDDGRPSPRDKWVFGVYDYRANRYKIVKCGWSVFNLIDTYSKDPDYGKPTAYDINIEKNSARKPVSFILKAGVKKPLGAAEQSSVDSKLDLTYIETLAGKKTPAQIYRAMTYIRSNLDELFINLGLQRPAETQGTSALPEAETAPAPVAAQAKKAKPTVSGTSKVKVVEPESGGDEDFEDFPSA